MKTSIATVSISGDLPEKLDAIAKAGFSGVEIFENDFLAFDANPRDVGRMVRDHGLAITLFQPFRDFEGMPEPHRSRAFDRAERKFDVMQELGTDLVLVCSNVSPIALGGLDRAADDFRELGERAKKRGLRVGYEALAWGRHINDHRDAWEIVRRADHTNVGLILDSFHTLARKIDVNSIRSIPKEKILIVQLADAPLIDMDLLYWSRHYRNMPGEGDLPVVDFMRAVAATGYDGFLSLEIFNDQFRGGSPRSIALDGHRSLIYLGDQIQRLEPDVAMTLPRMPDRIQVDGVAFVEFSASEEEAEQLGGLLRALGFHVAGQHKTKLVTLYRQGGINLVINTEHEGFAHSSYLVHGTSAYAIGLEVDDAKATAERARALIAEPFEQTVGPGELTIPAIRGVGGGIIYFIDQKSDLKNIWEIEFNIIAGAEPWDGVGLRRVDHVAQTMKYDEMLTWVLFYTSIFKAHKTPMVDIVDPAGIVRSQVIENDDGRFRLTLNGAENRTTLAGHFITENFGSGVQHLAFETNDIFATASALHENGFTPLQISSNYYDDLEARFGLDIELSDRLRSANILYDRDENGEYFQLYSPNYGEGFFFEVVQRNGYRGYGASNSIFRIAAQKRHLRPKGMPRV
ncbi:bifunctional sugar phosphate isomerase/epimerase/4-hydroxyphenylpyruvate dioxygenase family protein [Phyllobacterium zundukense]|jgi:4-hydroxyphenylpyruvate dioxygenase|uniref:Sugar phosphate isomerase/epimerase and 4-hydroxyphenylpyruvate domain-containing protein n=1 Tax=Phyllobacterium zundukense TaxID=1867719 RepID=A0ACD4D5F1_9HYPH|nr:sugar phosphate isomerase/epimerase and 4-hydroxyphenylpyruvate domain-containing protein [Phyllobacterium zundukense]UXN60964.1 sugar phosphate isomerase/epimerase and 4-hydroxyphenylpyruvate domain-containing protein [Phyllobacterium zundukense]